MKNIIIFKSTTEIKKYAFGINDNTSWNDVFERATKNTTSYFCGYANYPYFTLIFLEYVFNNKQVDEETKVKLFKYSIINYAFDEYRSALENLIDLKTIIENKNIDIIDPFLTPKKYENYSKSY